MWNLKHLTKEEQISGTGQHSIGPIDTMAINCYDGENIVRKKVSKLWSIAAPEISRVSHACAPFRHNVHVRRGIRE
jgi:hypothetical protein